MSLKKSLLLSLIFLLNININIAHAEEGVVELEEPTYSYVMIDPNSFIVLDSLDKDVKKPPASITKIMTALLVLEKSEDNLSDEVYYSDEAIFSLPPGSSHIAMNPGEVLSVYESMYGLMLPSANEVANALSEYVAGDVLSFATLMNIRAKELGAINTHFINGSGLHEEGHYTTAYDITLIMAQAIKHPFFNELIKSTTHTIPPTNLQVEERVLYNSNKLIQKNSVYYDPLVVGSKTGYTNEAKHTLVTYATDGENELIVSVLGASKGDPYTITSKLLEEGFKSFEDVTLIDSDEYKKTVNVYQQNNNEDSLVGTVTATSAPLTMSLPVNNIGLINDGAIDFNVVMDEKIYAPINAGDQIGSVVVSYNGKTISKSPMIAVTDVVATNLNTIIPSTTTQFGIEIRKILVYILSGILIVGVITSLAAIFFRVRKANRSGKTYRYKDSVKK